MEYKECSRNSTEKKMNVRYFIVNYKNKYLHLKILFHDSVYVTYV